MCLLVTKNCFERKEVKEMTVFRTMDFKEVYKYLRKQFPEGDSDYLLFFLRRYYREPFTVASCYSVARELEKLIYC